MISSKALEWAKRNWGTMILAVLLALLLFFPAAKGWMLRQAISTGLLNAKIENKEGDKNNLVHSSFVYADLAGNTTSTDALAGKVVFINFWATWCPPCIAEMPSLSKLYEQFKDDDRFVFLFITQDDDPAKAAKYLSKHQYNLPLYTLSGNINPQLYSGTLPTTIVLNKQGKMVFNHQGIAGYNSDSFVKQLKELL